MKIYVNSRIFSQTSTGVSNYISCLFRAMNPNILENIFFVQPSNHKTLGNTIMKNVPNGFFGAFLFDVFLCQKGVEVKGPTIFHGMSFILPLFKKKRVKYVVSVHDLSFKIFKENHSRLFNAYYNLALAWSLKNADAVIAISENTKKDIINLCGIEPEKIKVTYLAGDDELKSLYEAANRKFDFKYFFTLSTHPKRKNVNSVLKAFSESEHLKNTYKLILAGKIDAEQKLEVEHLIKELRLEAQVVVLGYVPKSDLASLYKYAEFFIYPSFYEGFGIPVVDALALNCPVITSNTSCLPEVVPEKYEYLVDPYSIEDIRHKMEKMVSLSTADRQLLITNNKKFSDNFSWEITAKKTIEVYNSLYEYTTV